jgi:hypothetical protein
MCECDYGDGPSVQTTKVRKAAKEHRCYECAKPIAKGDLYQVTSGVWDGRGDSFKWCDTCATIANLAEGMHPGFCYEFGNMLEAVEECILAYEPDGRWARRSSQVSSATEEKKP